MADATMRDVMLYFEYPSAAKFAPEWKALTDQDKTDLKKGIGDKSLTY